MINIVNDRFEFRADLPGLGNPRSDIPDIPVDHLRLDVKIEWYENLLVTAILQRAMQRDPSITSQDYSKVFPHIKYALDWLRKTDFYSSPASTKYHDAKYGGLLNHTLEAYVQLVGLRSVPKFKSVVSNQWWSAVLAILVHDWCKIGRYEHYLKNVKDEDTGEWAQEDAYRIKDDDVTRFGHGTQSLIMATQLFNSRLTSLTFEEMAAIRWHMDAWDIGHYDDADLHKCDEKIPMVRMIQFADQLAITTY